MNETYKTWLIDLYNNEIVEKEQMIRNERIWRDASTTKEAVEQIDRYIQDIKEYIEMLKEKINELQGGY